MGKNETRAAGHGIYRDDEHGRRELAGGITFVDRAAARDKRQDGTAEHPYAAIGRAVAKAGENRTIFVQEGEYDELVVLEPGQTLTSEIRVDDEVVHAARFLPLIRPKKFQPLDENEEVDAGEEKEAAAVLLRGSGTLCRLRVETCRDKAHAVLVAPAASDERGLVRVERCELRTEGRFANVLCCRLKGEPLFGRGKQYFWHVELSDNTASALGADGIVVRLGCGSHLGSLELSGNTVRIGGNEDTSGIRVHLVYCAFDKPRLDSLKVSGNAILVAADGILDPDSPPPKIVVLAGGYRCRKTADGFLRPIPSPPKAIVLDGEGLPDAAELEADNAVWLEAREDKKRQLLRRAAAAKWERLAPAAPPPEAPLTNSLGMTFAMIPAGRFLMGSPDGEGQAHEHPRHEVTISRPFRLMTTPVTRAQWHEVMGGETARAQADLPAEGMTWEEVRDFVRELNRREGHAGYRLPTEAEWEYACRAGSGTAFCFGDDKALLDEYAWHADNSGGRPRPVAQKRPNAWGLYDMHGNVDEWCSDFYGEDSYALEDAWDPQGPPRGWGHVLRGGAWLSQWFNCRSARRYVLASGLDAADYEGVGLRLAWDVAAGNEE